MAANELLKPLGVKRPGEKRPVPYHLHLVAAGALTVLAVAGIFFVVTADDPFGQRTAIVEIPPAAEETRTPATAPAIGAASGSPATTASGSGLIEMTPDGGLSDALSGEVVIRDPTELDRVALSPVPIEKLLQPTRHGMVPRVAEDGTRPFDAYARPVGRLPVAAGNRIAIVVGGLGISEDATRTAIERLPDSVSLAFAPYESGLDRWVGRARQGGHEVLLQIPLEPFDYPRVDPGPRTLTVAAAPSANLDHLHWLMSRFSTYVGVINFMGARFTAEEDALVPVMAEIGRRGLLYLDDGSSSRSRAALVAPAGAPFAAADLVIDAAPEPEAIDAALRRLEAIARQRGSAIGTASAFPATVERIAEWARQAGDRGIVLVPVSALARTGG